MRRKFTYYVGDFETTVFKGQDHTEVWASAVVQIGTEDVKIFHSIGETFDYLKSLNENVCIYYHNLKFDGSFWLSYLIKDTDLTEASIKGDPNNANDFEFIPVKDMKSNTFSYSISNMGQWYRITIKVGKHIIEIRDSLKLLPFSVKRIGDSFKTKHKKLEMKYTGFKYAGCEITEEEQKYIANDVLVIKEALEFMFEEGHDSLTIGSCCMKEFKKTMSKQWYNDYFPDVYSIELEDKYEYPNAGEYIKRSYKGGWCYLAKGKEQKLYHKGTTADVNSLYPSMMSSESGNAYPVGKPCFWSGNYIPDEALKEGRYYFIRIKTRFYLKEGYLPFIQIKNTFMYKGNESLETSDIYDPEAGGYCDSYVDFNGDIKPATVTLTLTMTDFQLIKEHYELVDFEILDGCYFEAVVGLFDDYIDKYKKIKLESKGAMRELAKLFLNNLYGKLASSKNSSFKVAYLKEDKSIGFYTVTAYDKQAGYIPIGSAITSYARNFTIRAAQKNYYGPDKRGFIYADTDSIHCDLEPDEIRGITVDDKNFCCWKLESCWDEGIFIRQKTYIEHVVADNLIPIEPFYNVKCAGMPTKCKDLFIASVQGFIQKQEGEEGYEEQHEKYTQEEIDFMSQKRELSDFTIGLRVPGKLLPKRIQGGVLLVDTYYEMR